MTTTSPSAEAPSRAPTRKLVRGGSLLFAGRLLSKGANFAVQVLIVRHLSQGAYGAFAYALSIVLLGQGVLSLGLNRAVSRFVPIYHEEKDYDRLFGALFLMVGTMVSLGVAVALLVHASSAWLSGTVINDELALSLLLILVFLAPVQAIDELLIGLFASFASPKSIFYRKHVVAPALKLTVVGGVIVGGLDVTFLAWGYLAAAAVGVLVYSWLFVRILSKKGILAQFRRDTVHVPWREVFAFSLPLMTTDLVFIVMNTMDAVMLEMFHDTEAVASLRAVQPAAKMNQLIMMSLGVLYLPAAARLFARKDHAGINDLYWQTAIFLACFSFPIFALTFSISETITGLLYGERYAGSASILALLSFGYYFNAALGFNGLTLKVFHRMKYVVTLNVLTALLNLGLNLWLIPRYGALGAAIGTLCALVIHNVLKQAGLRLGTGISIFDARYSRVYLAIILVAAALLQLDVATNLPPAASVGLAAVGSLVVLRANRKLLTLEETFPEVFKIPGMRWILR